MLPALLLTLLTTATADPDANPVAKPKPRPRKLHNVCFRIFKLFHSSSVWEFEKWRRPRVLSKLLNCILQLKSFIVKTLFWTILAYHNFGVSTFSWCLMKISWKYSQIVLIEDFANTVILHTTSKQKFKFYSISVKYVVKYHPFCFNIRYRYFLNFTEDPQNEYYYYDGGEEYGDVYYDNEEYKETYNYEDASEGKKCLIFF